MQRITVKQMAKELGCNLNYIYDLLALNYIRHIKVGDNYKVKVEWWEEFLDGENKLPSYAEASRLARVARRKAA